MIDVLVTVGVYSEFFPGMKTIKMTLPALPQIGDIVLLNTALSNLIREKHDEWKMSPDIRINYVRAIGYQQNGLPLVMLSTSPRMTNADCFYKGDRVCAGVFETVPARGDALYVHTLNRYLYVHSIGYASDSTLVSVYLSDKEPVLSVCIENTELDVAVRNTVDVNILH